jgi:hypothetical protein
MGRRKQSFEISKFLMSKPILFVFGFFLFFASFFSYNGYAQDQEVSVSEGKVITGLDRKGAMEKYGVPVAMGRTTWRYAGPPPFFVYFPPQEISDIWLYPQFSRVSVGTPVAFKIYGYVSGSPVKDITDKSTLLIKEANDFLFKKGGILVPRVAGEYDVIAKYQDKMTIPARLTVKEPQGAIKKEKLINIYVLPHRPIVRPQETLHLLALGIFLCPPENQYVIRDISEGAEWFLEQDKKVVKAASRNVAFPPEPGKYNISCTYLGVKSSPQEAEVRVGFVGDKTLKHITLLPESIFGAAQQRISLQAFGTYADNRVEDLSAGGVAWKVSDRDVLSGEGSGRFLQKQEGVCDVVAAAGRIESLPAEVIVMDWNSLGPAVSFYVTRETQVVDPEKLIEEMKSDVEDLDKEIRGAETNLEKIVFVPDSIEVAQGEGRQVVGWGVYSDGSRRDLTLFGDWTSSDVNVFTVSGGQIKSHEVGTAMLSMKFGAISSPSVPVVVNEPRLVSLVVAPQVLEIAMAGTANFKVEGYFSDSSHKDMTSSVTWTVSDPKILKMEGGKAFPRNFGSTRVTARSSQIQSLPVSVRVVLTLGWLRGILLKTIIFLLLVFIVFLIAFYIEIEVKKDELRACLQKDPPKFILKLYDNLKNVLMIYGFKEGTTLPPLYYANLACARSALESRLFLNFTKKFEEVKYSKHAVKSEEAASFLNEYNQLLKMLFSGENKTQRLLRACLFLMKRQPLFVPLS